MAKPTGRPTDYTEALGVAICERIVEHGTLAKAVEGDEWPSVSTVYRWIVREPAFRDSYARARELSDEVDAERMREVAGDASIMPDHKRVMVDVLKWQMARRQPKKWGDRVNHAGVEGAPIGITITSDDAGL